VWPVSEIAFKNGERNYRIAMGLKPIAMEKALVNSKSGVNQAIKI